MGKGVKRAPSQRQLRVGEEIRHALAWIIERGELRDPGLSDRALTVTEVRVSPDLKQATAFVTPLGGGGGDEEAALLESLARAAPFLRSRVARALRLKYAPEIVFSADHSFDEASRIERLIAETRARSDDGA